jgi:hypothetical protein
MDVRYPVFSTSLTYGENGNYSDLHVKTLSYVASAQPYKVSMIKGANAQETQNSTGTGLSAFAYKPLQYLGTTQFLNVKNEAGDTLLITPTMDADDAPLLFTNKTLLTQSYNNYGAAVNGYVLFDTNASQLQNCSLDMTTCTAIAGITEAPTYLGDLGGTAKGVLSVGNTHYVLDKSANTLSEIKTAAAAASKLRAAAVSHMLSGNSIYSLVDHNIVRTDLDGTVEQISTDSKADRLKAFTDDMVIYGGDSYMYAVKKDGSIKDAAIEISVQTKTRGQKYPHDLGIGKQYLYTTYSVDVVSGKNTFYACVLEDGKKECKADSYWSAVTAAKDGVLNHSATYFYTPYAYIRVDETDNYGGGKVKAIDPKNPLAEGTTMGEIATYNFQTFVNSTYDNDLIDSNGDIILYAKNDLNFRGDAFLMNLRQENSMINLTNEPDPDIEDVNGGGAHCHGRMCTICHSFAGGKIYKDKAGSASAINHNIRFDFEDGSESVFAKIRKGQGENFNTPLENLVGKNFKAVVIDENGTDVVRSIGYYHKGAEFFNCNYCHARGGVLLHDAPNVITSEE